LPCAYSFSTASDQNPPIQRPNRPESALAHLRTAELLYLACALSSTISAAAPVAANNYVLTKLGCRPTRPVSILEVHGTADQIVPYYGTSARISPQWPLPSIRAWVSAWAQLDQCTSLPIVSQTRQQTIFRYRRCAAGTDVTLYRINGGGHTYPRQLAGRPSNAVIYQFFKTHRR
jgi:polyhydroxybutyrate depolymerase